MKIGVISDTHIPKAALDLPEVIYNEFVNVDLILHAGDFVEMWVLGKLQKLAPVKAVYGNMDMFDVREMLPPKKVIELGHYRIGLMHGWGSSNGLEERVRSEFQNPDVIVYGHSHRPANHMKDGILFFNPGTAIGYSSNGVHTLGVLNVGDEIYGEIINI